MRGQSISHQLALRLAWEDPKTIFFIQTSFSHPEQRPEILSRTWITEEGQWNVSIIEKSLTLRSSKDSLINVAWVEIDSKSGHIQSRRYFRNIFLSEYQTIIQERSSP